LAEGKRAIFVQPPRYDYDFPGGLVHFTTAHGQFLLRLPQQDNPPYLNRQDPPSDEALASRLA
jgi:hypothetical protein